jgi:signal transduction histidine kinase
MGLRLRSVRQRILLLVLVPVLSLIGLYAYSTAVFSTQAINLARTLVLKNSTAQPAGNFYGAVGRERPLALVYLARPTADALNQLKAAELKTQAAAVALKAALTSPGTTGNESTGEKAAIRVLLADVAGLPAFNEQVQARSIGRDDAYNHYNKIISDGTQVINQAILQENDPDLVTQSLALVRVGRSEEMLARELALLVSDVTSGSFPQSDRVAFTQLAGARRQIFADNLTDLITQYQREYARVTPQDLAAIKTAENRIINSRGNRLNPALFGAFQQTFLKIQGGESAAASRIAVMLTDKATHDAELIYIRLLILGGLGLLAVIASLVVTFLLGRGLVRELAELRGSAEDLAGRRLPEVIRRLREGEDVDTTEDAPVPAAKISEIRQVGEAFGTVRRTAVEAAVGEARLRRGISDIFRNLARRSQSLLHRQLALLDAMERRADQPDELEDLFRIDHLTTRMRRHAESLIILSGDAPARGWRNPVPLVDVLRAAVAEVEDYTRIRVTATTRAGLAGPAVGDMIHMIAELAENAAIFSPPNTPVLIGGDVVGRGFAIEIEDRGLGMSEEQRAEINERLANPPPFDLSGSDQLGLFVAGQLAKRHNVKISLRSSPYGGTTAIVLIPLSLVVPEGAFDEDQIPDERLTRRTGRHVARDDRDDADGYPGETNGVPGGYGPAPGWPPAPEPARHGDPFGTLDRSAAPSGPSGLMTAEAARPGSWSVEPAAPPETEATSPGFSYPAAPELSPSAQAAAGPSAGRLGSGMDQEAASPGREDLEADGELGDAELLPRRIRQANLAPQLRDDTLTGQVSPATDAAADDTGEGRSPDEIRATMSAIQQGWQKGRSVFDPPDRGRGLTASDQDEAGSPAESSGTPSRPPGKK